MKHLKMFGLAAVAAMALMAVVGAGSASATTLYLDATPQNKAITINATLTAGSTAILKDEGGTTTDTCNVSQVSGTTASPFTGATVGGPVSTLSFSGCSHTTKVLKNGSLSIDASGNVVSKEAEVTVVSTAFGISAVCKTGAGTKVGTFNGTNDTTKHATITIDATNSLNCGILGNSSWTGSYTVTSPTGLNVGA
jgi:uncharacterized protein YpuA (DUF1002 family)